jgi:hypothetical protein
MKMMIGHVAGKKRESEALLQGFVELISKF